jgi:hypothetical protein
VAVVSIASNSVALIDTETNKISAEGLTPSRQYQVYLSESADPPFDKLQPLAVLKTNPDGAGIAQAIGPLKTLARSASTASDRQSRRFLIVSELNKPSQVVLRQAASTRQK